MVSQRPDSKDSPPNLGETEIGPFQRFLFGNIAKRPANLTLPATAKVARYLERLALQGIPKRLISKGTWKYHPTAERRRKEQEFRNHFEPVAKEIWVYLRQY